MKTLWSEPFRLFFPLGILYLLCGILVWIPQIWTAESYPIHLHRYLVLNGFVASFIGGFLMTAVPRFSKTIHARPVEVLPFFLVGFIGTVLVHLGFEQATFIVSALQVLMILGFLLLRIFHRQENPPYSFIFIFVGLFLWLISALGSCFHEGDFLNRLHYEGAIAAIILGVGSRLIPGILGHVEIVSAQRERYEKPVPILSTVPVIFLSLIVGFVISYSLPSPYAEGVRAFVVGYVGLSYWRLYTLPKSKTSLTYSIWFSSWFIVLSFLLRVFGDEGGIHYSHAFFISGIVLLSLLIGTRVLQSHGPQDKELENWKGLYWVTGFTFLAAVTRVSAYHMPNSYQHHLGYSSALLTIAIVIWGAKYLRFSWVKK